MIADIWVLKRTLLKCNDNRIPPNVHFEVDDVEADWTYSNSFDYIHCRYMGNAIRDWHRLVRQCFEYVPYISCRGCAFSLLILAITRFTTPNGYTELVDVDVTWRSPDNSLRPNSICKTMNAEFLRASRAAGFEPSPGPLLEEYLKGAGFKNIKVQKHPVPIGPWALDTHLVSKAVRSANFAFSCIARMARKSR